MRTWVVVTIGKGGRYIMTEGPFKTQREARAYAKYLKANEQKIFRGNLRYKIERPFDIDKGFQR